MKYVVLARSKTDDTILSSFGVFKSKRHANRQKDTITEEDRIDNAYYCVEDVDPTGSFANDNVWD
jgi:hypothetical protein